jgi:hypothetical protein
MADTILDDQKAPIVVAGTDDQGNPVAGLPTVAFTSSDPTILTVDTTTATPMLVTTGKLGTAQLQASATLADGTVITGSDDVTVHASALAKISISLGAAVAR